VCTVFWKEDQWEDQEHRGVRKWLRIEEGRVNLPTNKEEEEETNN
jgi:hypothetical protein